MNQHASSIWDFDDATVERAVIDALRAEVRLRKPSDTVVHVPCYKYERAVLGSLLPQQAQTNPANEACQLAAQRVVVMLAARGLVLAPPYVAGNAVCTRDVVVLPRGIAVLEGNAADPRSQDYLEPLRSSGLSVVALSRVEDAIRCHFAWLPRPAIVMLGVAYEDVAIEVLSTLSDGARAQAERIANLHARLTATRMSEGERAGYLSALGEATVLNTRRNAGAHPADPDPTRDEVETHLRALPVHLVKLHGLAGRLARP